MGAFRDDVNTANQGPLTQFRKGDVLEILEADQSDLDNPSFDFDLPGKTAIVKSWISMDSQTNYRWNSPRRS